MVEADSRKVIAERLTLDEKQEGLLLRFSILIVVGIVVREHGENVDGKGNDHWEGFLVHLGSSQNGGGGRNRVSNSDWTTIAKYNDVCFGLDVGRRSRVDNLKFREPKAVPAEYRIGRYGVEDERLVDVRDESYAWLDEVEIGNFVVYLWFCKLKASRRRIGG